MSDSISSLTLERGIQWACSHLEQHISPASNLTSRLRWTCWNEATEPQGKDSDFFIWEEFEYLYASTEHSDLLNIDLIRDWFQSVYLAFCLLHFTFIHIFEPEPTSWRKMLNQGSPSSRPLLSLFNFNSRTIWKLKEIFRCNEVSSI